ncbi:magnesium/cobalt transporter CorA [Chamaesiphon minutus]|uniref:Magnesium transport protein CorA n=1 Tax=Chamaesiphon minutus (strain ATCC 27169 / PCC 6605) TaxID=1173020 RepID=K9UIH7_CHAP6|nr:magnesium/cobalt transporter CorA [Chamaesiphon minutus]AFY94004.1 magnesium Mg(2+) and cobalt Co(2+) transport protein CorA [Chamaesiphon minutus PCC 6605]
MSKLDFPSTYRSPETSRLEYFYDRPGTMPGQLHLSEDAPPAELVSIDYDRDSFSRTIIKDPETINEYLKTHTVSWIDVLGLGNNATWEALGSIFNLHQMLVEDIVNVPQRPKVEDYQDQLLIIATMVILNPDRNGFVKEQVSLVLGKNYLLTVQEEPEQDCFHGVRKRIELDRGIVRKQGADYLAYCLLDAIVDGFFPVLEYYGELIEELENEVITRPTRSTLEKIYKIRRELLTIRRAIWPQRDAINSLIRDGSDLISNDVQVYLRDCYDHTVQVMDMVETYRELATGLMDVYLSAVSNKMNEIMKLLTVVSAIFIPLTFIAGVYGMNFDRSKSPLNMPELGWYWGYPFCLALMGITAGSLVFFFWKRGWFKSVI